MADFLSESGNSFNHDRFPVGLRVLAVDDDPTVLKIIEQMSAQCQYHVTTCNDASVALNLLREKRDSLDVVLSDVHMPNMDGFKFLHHVDQEFNVPVVLMSVDGSSSSVMEGIRHGACHYLIKPIHQDDIRKIWQHVVRKKTENHNKEHEVGGVLEYNNNNNNPSKQGNYININIDDDDVAEYTCSVIDATEEVTVGGDDHHPMPAAKKPRFVWTLERHQQFLTAVGRLGNKVVPKKILELMDIPGLTRENVASHLQKFRLHLKKKSKATQEQNGILNGTVQPNNKLGSSTRFSMQALTNANANASRHVSLSSQAQAQAGFHATWNTSENHYSHSNNESSQQAAPKYDSNNIPYPYYHNDELMHFVAIDQQQQIMRQQYHHIHQNLPYCEHDFILDSFNNNNNIQPSSYIMAPPSQSQPYDETFQAGISPASDVSYNNNSYSFVGRKHSVLDRNTFSPQLLNSDSNNNNSSSLSSITQQQHGA